MAFTIINQTKFFDPDQNQFIHGSIIIKDDKIFHVDHHEANIMNDYKDTISENEDVKIIDGTDLYITPGFIDTCSQIGLKETGVRWEGEDSYEPSFEKAYELDVVDGIYPFDASLEDARAAGVTAAHVMSSAEQVIGAKTAVIHTEGKVVDEMLLKNNAGYSFSMGDIPKEAFFNKEKMPLTRMGIAQKIKETVQTLIENGIDMEEQPIFIRCYRKDDIDTALRIGRDFNIKPILVHAASYDPAIHQKTHETNQFIVGPCFQGILRDELSELSPDLFKELHDEKLNFTFSTDHPTSDVKHLRLEAILALKSGVPEQAILHGLTAGAAKLLGVNDQTGSIKENLFADLVIWDEHPLNYMAKVKHTFIKGKEVFVRNEK